MWRNVHSRYLSFHPFVSTQFSGIKHIHDAMQPPPPQHFTPPQYKLLTHNHGLPTPAPGDHVLVSDLTAPGTSCKWSHAVCGRVCPLISLRERPPGSPCCILCQDAFLCGRRTAAARLLRSSMGDTGTGRWESTPGCLSLKSRNGWEGPGSAGRVCGLWPACS